MISLFQKEWALRLKLPMMNIKNGFDRLIVLGVKNTDATNSKQLLEQLVTNHIYGIDGMNFLTVGTPTNNTHDVKSGFLSDDDTQQRYDIEINNIKYDSC